MCHYRVTKFRCGHKLKTTLPPCNLHPTCTRDQAALLELTTDLSNVRTAIRLYNASQYRPDYEPLIARLENDYKAFFGHGSGNRTVMASLDNLEEYLEEEIEGVAQNVVERVRSDRLCGDGCLEGALLLEREESGRSRGPQAWLIYGGYEDVVQLPLDHGADINAKERDYCVLAHAANNGESPMMRLLVARGIDIHDRDYGDVALELAAERGHEETVRLLVGMRVNVDGSNGRDSPILRAMI